MASVFKKGGKSNRRGFYQIEWTDERGKRKTRSSKTTDKSVALRIAQKLEAEAASMREGLIDPSEQTRRLASMKSLEAHFDDFEAKMLAECRSEHHIKKALGMIRSICSSTQVSSLAQLSAERVVQFSSMQRNLNRSPRTNSVLPDRNQEFHSLARRRGTSGARPAGQSKEAQSIHRSPP